MGATQAGFAKAVGVGRKTSGRWESGESQPQARHLARIAAVTGKEVAYFFTEDEDDESELSALRTQAEAMLSMSEHLTQIAREQIRKVDEVRAERRVTA